MESQCIRAIIHNLTAPFHTLEWRSLVALAALRLILTVHLPILSANSQVVIRPMKLLILVALGLLALPLARAQSESLLPPVPEIPTDVRLRPSEDGRLLEWTSTGPASWLMQWSSDLKRWYGGYRVGRQRVAGQPDSTLPPEVFSTGEQGYYRLVHDTLPPYIGIQPAGELLLDPGQDFELRGGTTRGLPFIARWYREGSLIASLTNEYDFRLTNQTLLGRYQVVLANPWGMVTSRVAYVALRPPVVPRPPVIELQPKDQAVLSGREFTLGARVSGELPFAFAWYRDGSTAPVYTGGSDYQSFLYVEKLGQPSGAFQLVVSNAWGMATSRVATVTSTSPVRHLPPAIVVEPPDVQAYSVQPFSLGAQTEGSLPLVHYWYRDGALLTTFTNGYDTVLTNQMLSAPYQLVASNAWGMVTSRVAVATVLPTPDYAPADIAGRLIDVHVLQGTTGGTFTQPIRVPYLYRLQPAGTGAAYTVDGLYPSQSVQGQYVYQRVNGLSAAVQLTPMGAQGVQIRLTFTSPTQGTFEQFHDFRPFPPKKSPIERPDASGEFTIIQ